MDEYVTAQAVAFRETLERLRAIIQSEAPEAEELIAYQVPCFKDRYLLVSFGVTKKACSFFTMSPELVAKDERERGEGRVTEETVEDANPSWRRCQAGDLAYCTAGHWSGVNGHCTCSQTARQRAAIAGR